MSYDAIVVGGGPAGLSAATWLGRYRRKVLVVDSGDYRNRWVDDVHGFLGSDPISPRVLRDRARRDLRRYPSVELRPGRVQAAVADESGTYGIDLEEQQPELERLYARRLVLATGVQDVFPDVGGFFEHYGKDVFHCPTCDGFDARGERVAVFGWSQHIVGFALELLDWAAEIRVVTNGRRFEADDRGRAALSEHGIAVIEDEAVELLGTRGQMEGVRLASGACVDCTRAFFSIEQRPAVGLARQLGCSVGDEGFVVVDDQSETTVAGVYAAGDLTPGMQLVPLAVAKGTVAGVACALSLHGEPPSPHAATPAPALEDVLGEPS
ncbi:MAG: NAD(P)/FAD-dependent oxidoreductase [Actinomycetota bacterium]|nr:NAD(P)/FAD-dependent oxidoreductase [Actinomycetota bacterium]